MNEKYWLAAWLSLGAACAHLENNDAVCPEYRDLKCAVAPECSMDKARTCLVCQCQYITVDPASKYQLPGPEQHGSPTPLPPAR